jgi:hypothetical protein
MAKDQAKGAGMSYGSKSDAITTKFEEACAVYRRFVFGGAPPEAIRAAAKEIYRYSNGLVLRSETMH